MAGIMHQPDNSIEVRDKSPELPEPEVVDTSGKPVPDAKVEVSTSGQPPEMEGEWEVKRITGETGGITQIVIFIVMAAIASVFIFFAARILMALGLALAFFMGICIGTLIVRFMVLDKLENGKGVKE